MKSSMTQKSPSGMANKNQIINLSKNQKSVE
ncbi:MAG: hypothetical protein ACI9UV_001721 [Algoriphagus sp.]|jgi:hypothetical protein